VQNKTVNQVTLKIIKFHIALLVLLLLSACQSTQPQKIVTFSSTALVINSQFKHILVEQHPQHTARLHVYIEGDGRPYRNRFLIAKDPSPQNPLILNLMMQDNTSSLYLGRPCYFNKSLTTMQDSHCNPRYWTSARYSEEVVNSMVSVLREYLSTHPHRGISLIGHSGGGTLAVLMAARMPEVDQVVTLAGNLDIVAWIRLHHYTPLKNSLNPADLNLTHIQQIHFGGDKDNNIPPALSAAWLKSMGQSMHILKDADHNCCWQLNWNTVLTQINLQMAP
jgi:hypothetical protein